MRSEFEQILRMTMNEPNEESSASPKQFDSTPFLAQMLGQIPRHLYRQKGNYSSKSTQNASKGMNHEGKRHSYDWKKPANSMDSHDSLGRSSHSRPSPQRPSHKMTQEQLNAFTLLNSWGGRLHDNFDSAELKSCFRKLALAKHPDHNQGRSDDFLSLKKAIIVLQELVNKDV